MIEKFQSFLRIALIKSKYHNVKISGCYLGKGVSIVCTDESRLTLQNCDVSDGTMIVVDHGGVIMISDSFIGRNCVIVAREKIEIDSHCQIAEMVVIRDQNHRFGAPELPIAQQGFDSDPIIIGRNVWLGAKSTVLKGVTIGSNAVLAAHAVVTHDLPEGVVAMGVPAKIIRKVK